MDPETPEIGEGPFERAFEQPADDSRSPAEPAELQQVRESAADAGSSRGGDCNSAVEVLEGAAEERARGVGGSAVPEKPLEEASGGTSDAGNFDSVPLAFEAPARTASPEVPGEAEARKSPLSLLTTAFRGNRAMDVQQCGSGGPDWQVLDGALRALGAEGKVINAQANAKTEEWSQAFGSDQAAAATEAGGAAAAQVDPEPGDRDPCADEQHSCDKADAVQGTEGEKQADEQVDVAATPVPVDSSSPPDAPADTAQESSPPDAPAGSSQESSPALQTCTSIAAERTSKGATDNSKRGGQLQQSVSVKVRVSEIESKAPSHVSPASPPAAGALQRSSSPERSGTEHSERATQLCPPEDVGSDTWLQHWQHCKMPCWQPEMEHCTQACMDARDVISKRSQRPLAPLVGTHDPAASNCLVDVQTRFIFRWPEDAPVPQLLGRLQNMQPATAGAAAGEDCKACPYEMPRFV